MCPSKAPDPGLLHEAIRGVGGANSGKLQGGPRRRGRAAPGAGGPIAPRPGYRGVAVPTRPEIICNTTGRDGSMEQWRSLDVKIDLQGAVKFLLSTGT